MSACTEAFMLDLKNRHVVHRDHMTGNAKYTPAAENGPDSKQETRDLSYKEVNPANKL